jgi:hypothetical protein
VEAGFATDAFSWQEMERRTVAHEDGRLKRSAYLSVYRVLERVPLSALKKLYLVTDDGRVLGLDQAPFEPESPAGLHHLYQELCPMTPRVVSNLSPPDFCKAITNPANAVSVPRIVFAELELKKLARDPSANEIGDLPYRNIGHLRDCLRELETRSAKTTKQVDRGLRARCSTAPSRTASSWRPGADALLPAAAARAARTRIYEWWRSAQDTFAE